MPRMNDDTQMGAALAAAMRAGRIIRVMRGALEPDAWAAGYVLAASADLVLMHRLSEHIGLDGYEILRIRDIDEMEDVSPRLDFYARALSLKGERPRRRRRSTSRRGAAPWRRSRRGFPCLSSPRKRTGPTR